MPFLHRFQRGLMMDDLVRQPVLFNAWKHHMNFLMDEIRKGDPDRYPGGLKKQIKTIGNSTTDLYTGNMDIFEIVEYCMSELTAIHLHDENSYLEWIRQSRDFFRLMDFPDGSVWVLKIGTEPNRYVHLHPGRNLPHTLRVKATVLKTAWLVNLFAFVEKRDPLDIDLINFLRMEILGLSPIKYVTLNHELGRMIFTFGKELGTVD